MVEKAKAKASVIPAPAVIGSSGVLAVLGAILALCINRLIRKVFPDQTTPIVGNVSMVEILTLIASLILMAIVKSMRFFFLGMFVGSTYDLVAKHGIIDELFSGVSIQPVVTSSSTSNPYPSNSNSLIPL